MSVIFEFWLGTQSDPIHQFCFDQEPVNKTVPTVSLLGAKVMREFAIMITTNKTNPEWL